MRTAASTADQSHDALRQVEVGRPAVAVCRQLGPGAQTFSTWTREVTGRGLAMWRPLRQLAGEHRELKQRGAVTATWRTIRRRFGCG